MEGKKYSNSFASSGMAKEEGRAAYYKLLDSVRDGDTVRIKRGVYATAEQLADIEDRCASHCSGWGVVPFLRMERAWAHHLAATSLPHCREKR